MLSQAKPTQLLKDDHKAVLQKLSALENLLDNLNDRNKISAELKVLTEFFKTEFWVHFTKEEEALFPEMETFIPRNAGPIGMMLIEHEDLRKTNDLIQEAVVEYLAGNTGKDVLTKLHDNGLQFVQVLRNHIHKEDNILFMMADMHLSPEQVEKVAKRFQEMDKQ